MSPNINTLILDDADMASKVVASIVWILVPDGPKPKLKPTMSFRQVEHREYIFTER